MSIISHPAKLKVQQPLIWLTRWWSLGLISALFLGGILRLSFPSMMEFRYDSAYWSMDAYRILRGGYVPLVGQQVGSVNVELYNGPIMSYIAALAFAVFGYQPMFAAMLIAACNIVGILITFLLGKRLYSRNVGLMAAMLMSLSPWLILYGRMLWPQSLFPCLIPLSFMALLVALETDKLIWYMVYGVLLGIGLQLHLSVVAMIGTSILFTLICGRRKWTALLVVLGVAVGYAPVLLYDALHGFANIGGLLRLPTLHAVDEPRIFHFAKTLWNFANILSGQGLWVSKLSKSPYLPALIDWTQGILFGVLFLIACSLIVVRDLRSQSFRQATKLPYQDVMLLLFVILPMAYLFLSQSSIQRHYFLFFYPIPFLIIARGVELWHDWLVQKEPLKYLALLAPLGLAVACVLNLVTVIYAYNFLSASGGEGEYGTVLEDKQSAVDFVRAHCDGSCGVNLEAVQETLPYVFLFQIHDPNIVVEGKEDSARSISLTSAEGHPSQYRIVEPAYHDLVIMDGEKVLYQSRGIVVISQR